jgi:pimeloyl-ACP methyl ester carboxylesterase
VATFEQGPVTIRYESWGEGPAVLLLAPGGLRASRVETWAQMAWNPIEALKDRYRVVAMDQRNSGQSFAPITPSDGWGAYAADQLALMDHLGIEHFAVIGMCIGGSFIATLLRDVPDRLTAAVVLQTIGRDGNLDTFQSLFADWRGTIERDHPEADDAAWDSVCTNLFGTEDVLWSVPDAALEQVRTPVLILQGDDVYHPKLASQRLASLIPGAALIEHWKDPDNLPGAAAAINAFLADHAH